MKIGNFNFGKGLVWTVLIGGLALYFIISAVSFYNAANRNQNLYKKNFTDRTSSLDALKRIIGGKAQATSMAEDGFLEVVTAQMDGRKDAEGLAMKWIKEANPAATYADIVKLYQELTRTIESQRMSFLERETNLSAIVQEQDNLITQFPNNIWAGIMGFKAIEYKPIVSTAVNDAIRTGIDDTKDF